MTLDLILAHDEDMRLNDIVHPYERYSIALELHDEGCDADWHKLLDCDTVGDLARLVDGLRMGRAA